MCVCGGGGGGGGDGGDMSTEIIHGLSINFSYHLAWQIALAFQQPLTIRIFNNSCSPACKDEVLISKTTIES